MSDIACFSRPNEEYTRQIHPVEDYINQASLYVAIKKNIPEAEARALVATMIRNKSVPTIKNPTVKYLERGENGDREVKYSSLSSYIKTTVENSDILAPTFTTYLNPKVKRSILSTFIKENVKRRSESKKESLAALAVGDMVRYTAKNNEQGIMKIWNNSLSGAFGSNSTALFNLTAHSTLTSATRSVGSLGNAINEKVIAGNRHYRNYHIVLNNIISIISSANLVELKAVMEQCGFVYPSAEQALECVKYSTDLYWRNEFYILKIYSLLKKLSPLQLAAFMYIGDLYHIRKLNSDFVYRFLDRLRTKCYNTENSLEIIQKTNEHILNLACQICATEIQGLGKKYDKMPPEVLNALSGTILNIQATLADYHDFIRVFLASNIIPASVAYIPSIIRRTVVLSDTDSTMFSTDEYVRWYYGEMIFSPEAFALAASVMFLSTQSIANGLKILSANIGVESDQLGDLTMKPEYSFPVFVQTPVAKHYFASITVQEGNVFSQPKYEIKGVHLKSSAVPPEITALSKNWMQSILDDVANNKKISLTDKLRQLMELEKMITDSIDRGEVKYFRTAKIKHLEAYAGTLSITPYFYHVLWEEVFKPKYGEVEPIPNTAIKVPLNIPNKTACHAWINSIEDTELATRLRFSLTQYKKETLKTILVNRDYCMSKGIPAEIIRVIDKKKIVLELTKTFRMIVESLGCCIKKDFLISELGM